MITPSDFKTEFPAFANTDDAKIQYWLDKSDPYFNIPRWGDLYDDGLGNWVAHQLTMQILQGTTSAAGVADDANMKKVGNVQKGRDSMLMNKAADEPYYKTQYGQQFMYLRKFVGAGGMAV